MRRGSREVLTMDGMLGAYRTGAPVGHTSLGELVQVSHGSRPGQLVALVLSDVLSDDHRFTGLLRLQMARASGLHHPAIAHVVEVGEQAGRLFVVFECPAGETLATRLARGPALGSEAAVSIVRTLAAGLDAAHQRRLAHGLLGPEWVVLGDDGAGVLVGLGVQAAVEEAGLRAHVGPAPGHEPAPDQSAAAPAPVVPTYADAPTDRYALGRLAQSVLGTSADREPVVGTAGLAGPSAVLLRQTRPAPAERYPSCTAFVEALAAALAATTVAAPAAPAASPAAAPTPSSPAPGQAATSLPAAAPASFPAPRPVGTPSSATVAAPQTPRPIPAPPPAPSVVTAQAQAPTQAPTRIPARIPAAVAAAAAPPAAPATPEATPTASAGGPTAPAGGPTAPPAAAPPTPAPWATRARRRNLEEIPLTPALAAWLRSTGRFQAVNLLHVILVVVMAALAWAMVTISVGVFAILLGIAGLMTVVAVRSEIEEARRAREALARGNVVRYVGRVALERKTSGDNTYYTLCLAGVPDQSILPGVYETLAAFATELPRDGWGAPTRSQIDDATVLLVDELGGTIEIRDARGWLVYREPGYAQALVDAGKSTD